MPDFCVSFPVSRSNCADDDVLIEGMVRLVQAEPFNPRGSGRRAKACAGTDASQSFRKQCVD